jgi:ribosomal protein L40E
MARNWFIEAKSSKNEYIRGLLNSYDKLDAKDPKREKIKETIKEALEENPREEENKQPEVKKENKKVYPVCAKCGWQHATGTTKCNFCGGNVK